MDVLPVDEVLTVPSEAKLLQHYTYIAVFSALPDAWSYFEQDEWSKTVEGLRADLPDSQALVPDHGERFLSALQESDDLISWRRLLLDVAGMCSPAWQSLALAQMSLLSADADEDWWRVGGVGERRLNAVLDLVDFPDCTGDLRSLQVQIAEDVAAGKVTWKHTAALRGGEAAAGFAAGWFGAFGAVGAMTKGANYLEDRIAGVDTTAQACADLLMAALVLMDNAEPDLVDQIEAHLMVAFRAAGEQTVKAKRMRDRGVQTDPARQQKQALVLKAAIEQLDAFREDETRILRHVPDVVGQPAAAAVWLMRRLGVKARLTDASGDGRFIMNKENWVVTDQGSCGEMKYLPSSIELKVRSIANW